LAVTILRGPTLVSGRLPKKFMPVDTAYLADITGGTGGGLNTTALAALGVGLEVHAEAAPGGGWRWPVAGRPAWPAGRVTFYADGTGLAKPAMDGLVTGGGGMMENDRFYF
jgi:hypothetical protein